MSPFFDIRKGVRQGDPVSPTIFIIFIEIMNKALMHDVGYKGLSIADTSLKYSMFADDTVIFLDGRESQFKQVFDILQQFSVLSGLQINLEKSQGFYIGTKRQTSNKPLSEKGLQWPQGYVRYLGVYFPLSPINHNILFEKNFRDILPKIRVTLNL